MEENARLALGGSIDLVEQIVTGKVSVFSVQFLCTVVSSGS